MKKVLIIIPLLLMSAGVFSQIVKNKELGHSANGDTVKSTIFPTYSRLYTNNPLMRIDVAQVTIDHDLYVTEDILCDALRATRVGTGAGNPTLSTGLENINIGYQCGLSNLTGRNNTTIGVQAMLQNRYGSYNTNLGSFTGFAQDTSQYNVFNGYAAGYNALGSYNTMIGGLAGFGNTKQGNVFLGFQAGYSNNGSDSLVIENSSERAAPFIAGSFTKNRLTVNTSVATDSVMLDNIINLPNTTASNIGVLTKGGAAYFHNWAHPTADGHNLIFGESAGNFTMSPGGGASAYGSNNTLIGYKAGQSITSGAYNTIVGSNNGYAITSGIYNTILGGASGTTLSTGGNNIFVGIQAGESDNTDFNIFIGNQAGQRHASGLGWNVAVGSYAGSKNVSGSTNVYLGHNSGVDQTSGSENAMLGASTGEYCTNGGRNTFAGGAAGQYNAGSNNVSVGYQAGSAQTIAHTKNLTTSGGVYVGYQSGYSDTSDYNVFIGQESGYSHTTGNKNVFIGYQAGYNTLGADSLIIENSSMRATPFIAGSFTKNRLTVNSSLFSDSINASKKLAIGLTSPMFISKLCVVGKSATGNTKMMFNFTDEGYNKVRTDTIQAVDTSSVNLRFTTLGKPVLSVKGSTGDIVFRIDSVPRMYFGGGTGPDRAYAFSPNSNIRNIAPSAGLTAINTSASGSTTGGLLILGEDDTSPVVSGDRLGLVQFAGLRAATVTMGLSASIESFADETWSSTAMGSYMIFKTTKSGGGSPTTTERLRITPYGGEAWASVSTGNVVAGTGITAAMSSRVAYYNGNSAIDISAVPQIADGVDGQFITFVGSSDVNTLKLDDGDGLQLAGGVSFTIGNGDTITLLYIATLDLWVELSRSDN